jgi:hypothetical protein
MEPALTKQIPNWLVCDWFFAFFVINSVVAAILLLSILYLAVASKAPKGVFGFRLFVLLIQLALATTSTLFFYLICDRSLKPTK